MNNIERSRIAANPTLSPLIEKVERIMSNVAGGLHNLESPLKCEGNCVTTKMRSLSTYDFNLLTRLVVMAHDECVRVTIKGQNPKEIKIEFWNREREGDYSQRHPTIEEAINQIRGGK